jgi:hypothetical protein
VGEVRISALNLALENFESNHFDSLIRAGAVPGKTATENLLIAVKDKNTVLIRDLFENGANVSMENNQGQTVKNVFNSINNKSPEYVAIMENIFLMESISTVDNEEEYYLSI